MTESGYKPFMIFEIDESGNRRRLDITEKQFRKNNGRNVLDPKKVLVIVKEDLRRIFIWKGSASPVKKRFISARIATDLREELKGGAKIVPVDQGDEVEEFLNAFELESMPVTEILDDMRYVRNIEREKISDILNKKDIFNDEDDEYRYFPFPYIFKPPTPPGDLGLAGQPQAKQIIKKEEEEYEPYCKHCGSKLPEGQTICHVCGKKVI